jgi:Ca2+-binding EF-hand superfamily protein
MLKNIKKLDIRQFRILIVFIHYKFPSFYLSKNKEIIMIPSVINGAHGPYTPATKGAYGRNTWLNEQKIYSEATAQDEKVLETMSFRYSPKGSRREDLYMNALGYTDEFFKTYDIDYSGGLSRQELQKSVEATNAYKLRGLPPNKQQSLQKQFNTALNQFTQQMFAVFPKNQQGEIDRVGFTARDLWQDSNKDGLIVQKDYERFLQMMKHFPEQLHTDLENEITDADLYKIYDNFQTNN